MSKLRVLSYNIHKGFSTTNQKFVLDQIRDSIRSVEADIVFLQEVQGFHEEHNKNIDTWPGVSQFEFLADSVWSHFAYGRNAVYEEGHHGNAILSKFPIVQWDNINVSTNRFECRGLMHATVQVLPEDFELNLFCVHLGLFEGGREKQSYWLGKRIQEYVPKNSPFIMAGDFNDWRENFTHYLTSHIQADEVFKTLSGQYAKSFPAFFPLLRLDRIYFKGLTPVTAQVLKGREWRRLSDHLPLLVEFDLSDFQK